MAYFRPFSNVISIKTTRSARKKYLQYGGHPSMTSSRDVTASPLYYLKTIDAETICEALIQKVFTTFGIPTILVTDAATFDWQTVYIIV
jgi:glutamate formiminotransferase